MVSPGVAAGHPATAAAGIEILESGGTAGDAVAAACLASCVAETVMTGLLGGGHALRWQDGRAEALDCFVAVPGLGAPPREVELLRLEVPFGTELVHYAVGIGSCGVPGVPAGLEALRSGRLSWPQLVEPALRLARDGVELPPAHASCLAMLAPVMTMNEGAGIYAPNGSLLEAGERLRQPGLARVLELVADEGARTFYAGTLADELLRLMDERGGLVTRRDLEEYRVGTFEPATFDYAGCRFFAGGGSLSGIRDVLGVLPALRGASESSRLLAFARALRGRPAFGGDTTNVCAVDGAGDACVLTTSLGLGSGDFLPGLDLHLNSMLGEADLLVEPLVAGQRVPSMMSPLAAVDGERLVVVAGAAGGTRLAGALAQVLSGVLDEGLAPRDAVARPRLHVAESVAHVEPGFADDALHALEGEGYAVRRWPAAHHYFGGVSLIGRSGAAGDPRRDGVARSLSR